jgi:hypothetical protein
VERLAQRAAAAAAAKQPSLKPGWFRRLAGLGWMAAPLVALFTFWNWGYFDALTYDSDAEGALPKAIFVLDYIMLFLIGFVGFRAGKQLFSANQPKRLLKAAQWTFVAVLLYGAYHLASGIVWAQTGGNFSAWLVEPSVLDANTIDRVHFILVEGLGGVLAALSFWASIFWAQQARKALGQR